MLRIDNDRQAPELISLTVDGQLIQAYPGETLAAALYAAGIRSWRISRQGERRGLLCGMGICYDCLLTVNGVKNLRACQELVKTGQVVETGLPAELA